MVRNVLFAGMFAFFLLLLPQAAVASETIGGLFISELYRDPPGLEGDVGGGKTHEFIELFNSGRDAVPIAGLCITNGAGADSLVAVADTVPGGETCTYGASAVPSGGVAVILDRDYCLLPSDAAVSRFALPSGTVLLTISDSDFGSGGLAGDHGVALYRGRKNHIDTLYSVAADTPYVLTTPTGATLHLTEPENIEGYSLSAVLFDPGIPVYDYTADSISPGRVDGLCGAWFLQYRVGGLSGGVVPCTLQVTSFTDAHDVAVRLTGSGLAPQSFSMSLVNGQATVATEIPSDDAAPEATIAGCDGCVWQLDLSAAGPVTDAVHFSELFPRGTATEPEWAELYNSGSAAVNLRGWAIATSEDTAVITPVTLRIEPHAYLVLTKNAAAFTGRYPSVDRVIQPPGWGSLNNGSDTLFLLDSRRRLVETVWYDDDAIGEWPAVSIERSVFSQGGGTNVWTAPLRSTPGMPPQSRSEAPGSAPQLEIGPIPFTPDNDRRDDLLSVTLSLPAGATAEVTVYGFDGTAYATFEKRISSVFYWDGRCGSREAPAGPFFVCAEITNGAKKTLLRKKGILWRR